MDSKKPTAVRAKFKCSHITNYEQSQTAHLEAVYDPNSEGENSDFTKFTPFGRLEISIDKIAPAHAFYKPGRFYYLDFSEAPE